MDPDEREIMILEAMVANISFEGHDGVTKQFMDKAAKIRLRRAETAAGEISDHQD